MYEWQLVLGVRSPVKPPVGEVNVGPLRIALSSQRIGASSGLWLSLAESAAKLSRLGDLAGSLHEGVAGYSKVVETPVDQAEERLDVLAVTDQVNLQ